MPCLPSSIPDGPQETIMVKILQLNLNHCEAAQDLLTQTARELRLDLVLISEPYRIIKNRTWVTDTSAKAAIWACNLQDYQEVTACSGFVRAKVENIYFYSCYAPPSLTLEEFTSFLETLADDVKKHFPVAIAGDFNAWATDWGSKRTNARGLVLMEIMATLDVVLLNSGNEPTFTKGDASSIVDLTFVSTNLAKGNNSWKTTDIYTASDHQAIYWELLSTQPKVLARKPTTIGWKTSAFTQEIFQIALDVQPIQQGYKADEKAAIITQRAVLACDATMPRKRCINKFPPVFWWNDTIATLRKECVRAKRLVQRARKKPRSCFEAALLRYKEARRMLKNAIRDSKKKYWTDLLEEVDEDPWGRPYKTVMLRLKRLPSCSPTDPELLKTIVTVLFPQQTKLTYTIKKDEPDVIPPVTLDELLRACSKIGNNKAPGPDGIPNVAIKTAIKSAPEIFLDTYDTCFQEGTFPKRWKLQRLVLLHKENKPKGEPASYRPLCMLDTAGKILERIVQRRIEAVVEPQLADSQYGFRKGRSTLDAIDLVVNTAKRAIAGTRWKRGTKKYCLVATLDIKNAFNSARWEVIMEALAKFNVPGYLQNIVASYFTNRILRYDTDVGPKLYKVTGGVPQGSVLGPLLWNIMYDALLKQIFPTEARLVAFADDVAIVIVAKHIEEINWAFDQTYEVIQGWMQQVGLQLAEHKTEAVLITSRKQTETMALRVGHHTLTTQPFIRYLGVMIDARLKFKKHVEFAASKATTVVAHLSRLMPNVGGPKQKRRLLLSSVVTSVLTYGSAIWAGALTIYDIRRKAASVYRISALRVASAFRTVSEDAVCVIAGMKPIAILSEERKSLYHLKKENCDLTPAELWKNEREKSTRRWQAQWKSSNKGRWTYRLIPDVEVWVNRKHGEINYYLTQMLAGHGCFREYLFRFKHDDSPECPICIGSNEDAEHVFFLCPRYDADRAKWETALKCRVQPENIINLMLESKEAWEATNTYVTKVLKDLRTEERARKSAITTENS